MKNWHYLQLSHLLFLFVCITKAQEMYKEYNDSASDLLLENQDLLSENEMENGKGRFRRGIADIKKRWPGYPGKGVIPYVFDKSISPSVRSTIESAMKEYEKYTCIRFLKRDKQKDYIIFFEGDNCHSSTIGKAPREKQPQRVSIGEKCQSIGTVLHELGHVIGFYHEQSRADRDKYLRILKHHIKKGKEHNFRKVPKSENMLLNDFNHDSIMIYSDTAFSKSDNKRTIEAKNGQILTKAHVKGALHKSDIERVNLLYKCKNYKKNTSNSSKKKKSSSVKKST